MKENAKIGKFGSIPSLYPQINCVSDILAQLGYKNFFYKSADLEFANTVFFARQHNFHVMKGYKEWKNEKPSQVSIDGNSWGARDSYLYEQIKKTIVEMEKQGQPFSIFATTVDTHGEDYYVDPLCHLKEKTGQNVIKCADILLKDFITWCRNQPFYENLTIVIIGDHTAHGTDNPNYRQQPPVRQIENIFFNSIKKDKKEHLWTILDLAPTFLEAIGLEIPALGLGRSLFRENKTLYETYGKKLNIMLDQNSHFLENLLTDNAMKKFDNSIFFEIEVGKTYQTEKDFSEMINASDNSLYSMGKFWLRDVNIRLNEKRDHILKVEAVALTTSKERIFDVLANNKKIGKLIFQPNLRNPQPFEVEIPSNIVNEQNITLQFINNDITHWSIVSLGIGITKFSLH